MIAQASYLLTCVGRRQPISMWQLLTMLLMRWRQRDAKWSWLEIISWLRMTSTTLILSCRLVAMARSWGQQAWSKRTNYRYLGWIRTLLALWVTWRASQSPTTRGKRRYPVWLTSLRAKTSSLITSSEFVFKANRKCQKVFALFLH
jgi:hypothetical protein